MLAPASACPNEDLLERINRRKRRDPKFRPIVLKEDVSVGDIAFVKAHRYELPEISVEFQPRRRYVDGELAAHALGYVGEVTEDGTGDAGVCGFQIRRSGRARRVWSANTTTCSLAKTDSSASSSTASAVKWGSWRKSQYVAGNDLVTTIDLDLQRAAEDSTVAETRARAPSSRWIRAPVKSSRW